jgi:hypothetical protein
MKGIEMSIVSGEKKQSFLTKENDNNKKKDKIEKTFVRPRIVKVKI